MKRYNYKVSSHLHFQPVEPGMYVGWNRYFPSIFILNDAAREILKILDKNDPIEPNENLEAYLQQLLKYKFIYEGERDPSPDYFFGRVKYQLERAEKNIDAFYAEKRGYSSFTITNDACNLKCPYCLNQYKKKHRPVKVRFAEQLEIIEKCIHQFMERKPADSAEPVQLFFNGGEILLEWKLIEKIVKNLHQRYKEREFGLGMNTNLTLMTDEIAQFLKEYKIKPNISIDGYPAAHDRTRQYNDGSGSFDDILNGLEIYRKYNPDTPIQSFQGTIEFTDLFEPEAVYEMKHRDMKSARLAPNLLNATEADAIKKAGLMGEFLKLNKTHGDFEVTELFFTNAKRIVNMEAYDFFFNCRGLCGLPELGAHLNISTMRLSQLCNFIPDGTISLEELAYDIYNPKLGRLTYNYIKARTNALKNRCGKCELVGICCGGCIYTGLDNENQINKAACTYQKEMWRFYLEKAYFDRASKKKGK